MPGNQSDNWTGHKPFDGSEGNSFKEGNTSAKKHGLYQSEDKFYDEHPDLAERRDDLIDSLLEDCAHPSRQEHIIERYASLFVKLGYAHSQIGEVSENDTWDKLGALETKTQRWYDRIDWEEEESRKNQQASAEGMFFDALSGDLDEEDSDSDEEDEGLFDA